MLWSFFVIFLESQWQGIGEIIDSRSFKRNLTLWSQRIIFIFLLRTLNTTTVKATEHQVKQLVTCKLILRKPLFKSKPIIVTRKRTCCPDRPGGVSEVGGRPQLWRFPVTAAERLSSGPGEDAAKSPASVLGAWVYVLPKWYKSQEKTIQWIHRHVGNINNQIFMNYYYKELKQEGR